jgi:caa(3)-type oxidase subunit IV
VTAERVHPNYVAIWVWLVALMLAGVLATLLPLDRSAVVGLIFAIAGVKAVLVAVNYMHLKSENWLIYALAIVPVLLVIAMTLVLIPDIVHRH